ncbi:MAG: DUF5674 family protein [Acidobacteriota bacterium]
MPDRNLDILLTDKKIDSKTLNRLVRAFFGDMVKYVVDVRRRVVAIGGELHADGEQLLLEQGSQQADLWGANYYPRHGQDRCIEYTALINIRPAQENRSMEIASEQVRHIVREVTFELIGRGKEE